MSESHPTKADRKESEKANKLKAIAAGYGIIAGDFRTGRNCRVGRWYFRHKEDKYCLLRGPGWPSRPEAWQAICEEIDLLVELDAMVTIDYDKCTG